MLQTRDQLSLAALVVVYVALSMGCGVLYAGSIYTRSTTLYDVCASTTVVVPSAVATMLALWVAVRPETFAKWAFSFIVLLLVGYAFAFGYWLVRGANTTEATEALRAAVVGGTAFFVVYAYIMPIAAFWTWELIERDDATTQSSQRRLSLRQMFIWMLAITLPFGCWQLFVPDESNGISVLMIYLAAPIILFPLIQTTLAILDRTRFKWRIGWSVIGLSVFVAFQLVALIAFVAIAYPNRVRNHGFTNVLYFPVVMLLSTNSVCFLVAIASSVWLRLCGYHFKTKHSPLQPN